MTCWHHGTIPNLLRGKSCHRFIDCHIKPAFGAAAIVASIAFATLVSPEAFAANPIEEMAKQKIGGGLDPQGDSWLSMQHSLEQFMHPEFILRLFLSLSLAVACAWIVAWHPRSSRLASLSDLEERKTLILLGMVGAIVAELSGTSQTLAFVIFGIGALLRSVPSSTIQSSPERPSSSW